MYRLREHMLEMLWLIQVPNHICSTEEKSIVHAINAKAIILKFFMSFIFRLIFFSPAKLQ